MRTPCVTHASTPLEPLRAAFGERLQENILMANYTTAHVGGPVDAAVIAQSAAELENAVQSLWDLKVSFFLLGSGSNVLVSDAGLRGVVVINRAHTVKIDTHTSPPTVWAEFRRQPVRHCPPVGLARLERVGMGCQHPRVGRRSGVW